MVNNKQTNSKTDIERKRTSTKKTGKSNAVKKDNVTKKTNSTKSNVKNNTSKNINKTKTSKATQNKSVKKEKIVDTKEIKVKKVELADILAEKEDTNIEEKKNVEVINNDNRLKLEEAKFPNKREKKLLAIGIFVIILGIIALFITLIANRIVDREFLSDSSITLMMIASIIIEGFGAFIIINES